MGNFTLAELTSLAASVGFPNPPLAAAIAMAESGGNPTILGDTGPNVHGPSVGLWQIDLYYHPQYSQAQLSDPTENAKAAFVIWEAAGKSFSPWTTYTNGAYKQWYHPAAPPQGSSVTGILVGTLLLAGVTYLVVKAQ